MWQNQEAARRSRLTASKPGRPQHHRPAYGARLSLGPWGVELRAPRVPWHQPCHCYWELRGNEPGKEILGARPFPWLNKHAPVGGQHAVQQQCHLSARCWYLGYSVPKQPSSSPLVVIAELPLVCSKHNLKTTRFCMVCAWPAKTFPTYSPLPLFLQIGKAVVKASRSHGGT